MSCVINKSPEQHMRPYNPRPGAVSASERLRDNQLSSLTRVSIERFDLAWSLNHNSTHSASVSDRSVNLSFYKKVINVR